MFSPAGKALYAFTEDDEHYKLYIPDSSSQSKLFHLVDALGALPQSAQISMIPDIHLRKRSLFHSEYDRVVRSVLPLNERELDDKWAMQEDSMITVSAGIILAHKDVGRNHGPVYLDKRHMAVSKETRNELKRQIVSRWAPDDVYVSGQVLDVETYISSTKDLIDQAKSALIDKAPWHKGLYDEQVFRGENLHIGLCVIPVFLKIAWSRNWPASACEELKHKFIGVLEDVNGANLAIQTGISSDMGLVSTNLCSPASIMNAYQDGCEIASTQM